jgi:ribose-phosphate pyrophosphokinase
MKLFAGSASLEFGKKVASYLGLHLGDIEHHIFPDGEQRVRLKESVVDEDVVVIQSTGMPTDQNYIELFLLLDAAKRNGARFVTAVIPYVGYARQDHVFRTGEARSLEVLIHFMETAGATKIVTFDLHSIKIPELFQIPVVHLSALPLFASEIKLRGWLDKDTVLVSPDMGGKRRIQQLSAMLYNMPYITVEKDRDLSTGEISARVIYGEVKRRCILVDDIISSGKTILQAIELLIRKGAKEVNVFATHAVFSEKAPYLLQRSAAQKIFVTDTIFVPEEKRFEKLEVLSVADAIAGELRKDMRI